VEYAHEQQAANNNNTFTVCPNQVSPSASLPTATTLYMTTTTLTDINTVSAVPSSSGNTTSSSSQKAIIGGAVGGAALAVIAVLGSVYCIRRRKRPRMIQDPPSPSLDQFPGNEPVYQTLSRTPNQVLAVLLRALTDSRYSLLTTQRYNSFSPVRGIDSSRDSTLPMTHSLRHEPTRCPQYIYWRTIFRL